MLSRRSLLLSAGLLAAGCTTGRVGAADETTGRAFVTRSGTRLLLGGRRYRYAGANLWYGAYLGTTADYGNRDRLRRELDALASLGIDNVRVLASSELSPLKNSVTPTFRDSSSTYSATLLTGLDYLLNELGQRNMRAILYLTNFWEWSGGMMTYLYWTNGGHYINMNDPAHPWPEFPDFTAAFYGNAKAVGMYHDYVRAVVTRTSSITGRPYRDDPAIMAWQLANEPRPGGSDAVGQKTMPAFQAWVRATAGLIKSLDPTHLVSTGSEGLKGCIESAECVLTEHATPEVDYLTAHIWPLNWGWVDSANLAGTWDAGAAKVREYIAQHIAFAGRIGKPLVFEEFGFPRDEGLYDAGSPTSFKDRFYSLIYDAVLSNMQSGGPLAGSNFWAWGGEGRSAHADHRFQPGDTAYVGDPPHEPQGWYSVFDNDESTKHVIRAHAAAVHSLSA